MPNKPLRLKVLKVIISDTPDIVCKVEGCKNYTYLDSEFCLEHLELEKVAAGQNRG